jgi:hypothetical protein
MRAAPRTHLRVAFDSAHVLAVPIRHDAIAEAARIWNVYDIAIDAADVVACDIAGPASLTVAIVQDDRPRGRDGDASLGAVRFAADGMPEPTITLYLDAVIRIATSAPVMGLHPAFWPTELREQVVGRALGRALAHEIGHILLRSPHHADSGLMRAFQRGSTLAAPSPRPFALTGLDHARLRIALAAPAGIVMASRDVQETCPVPATR